MPPPRATAFGALVNYICHAEAKHFQPANITFDLLQPLDEDTRRRVRDKKQRHAMVCERALAGSGGSGWMRSPQTVAESIQHTFALNEIRGPSRRITSRMTG